MHEPSLLLLAAQQLLPQLFLLGFVLGFEFVDIVTQGLLLELQHLQLAGQVAGVDVLLGYMLARGGLAG